MSWWNKWEMTYRVAVALAVILLAFLIVGTIDYNALGLP